MVVPIRLHWHYYRVETMIQRSRKLGVTSVILFSSILLYRRAANWFEPILAASFVLSAVFGILAARSGSKWWLVTPAMVVIIVIAGLIRNVP
jgi:hypothetical protein